MQVVVYNSKYHNHSIDKHAKPKSRAYRRLGVAVRSVTPGTSKKFLFDWGFSSRPLRGGGKVFVFALFLFCFFRSLRLLSVFRFFEGSGGWGKSGEEARLWIVIIICLFSDSTR